MSVNIVTADSFKEKVLDSNKPVLVDFWAPWCGPCRMLSPVISGLADEFADKYFICSVNVDEEPDLARDYGVMSIPTLVVIKDGKVHDKAVGVKGRADILNMMPTD